MLIAGIFWLFFLAVAVQCCYAFYFFRHIGDLPPATELPVNARRHVSIIICARNEAANLRKNLPAILAQRYTNEAGKPLYDVIVVDDASTDDTALVLAQLKSVYDNLEVVTIQQDAERDLKGKKFALSKGVEQSAHDWLLFTDADCMPAGDRWLEQMVAPLAAGKEIVAGYGGYYHRAGLLNAFIRWETMHTFLQYSTYILKGKPYMAVGRNMACLKYIVLKAQRSELWNVVPSGDDDLLVTAAGTADNMIVVAQPSAFTWSEAKGTWRTWAQQKRRHLSTGKYYNDNIKLLLGFYGAAHTDAWLCFFILLFTAYWKAALAIMAVRCIIYWRNWARTAAIINEGKLIIFFPLLDLGWMIYNLAFLPYITWKNKNNWT
ncbi:MAG: glycosyltransferase [Bacteroidota bacterium]